MDVKKVTPILIVKEIEPNLPLWTEALGYTKTVEVPHGGRLGFVILERDGSEIMLQTHASLTDDLPAVAERARVGDVALFVEVASLDDAKRAASGLEAIVRERTTGYGMREIFVGTRDGHVLGFAQPAA